MMSLRLHSVGQSSHSPPTLKGRAHSPPLNGKSVLRVCGHVQAATASLQFPSSLVISDDLQQPISYNKPWGCGRYRGRADLQIQSLSPVPTVVLGVFIQSYYLFFYWFLQSWGWSFQGRMPIELKQNRKYAYWHERMFMLHLVSEESKGKIKWKSTYQDAKWLFMNGKFRHDFYSAVAYMLYLYCSILQKAQV